ncbi:six-hairpin glycosidase [Colletotrichum scovillei]|uniref:Six-hairpin glycosidase n=1 Tax=Colletotrichum scovillei TaxID=1209932 RepID=A0A9P7R2K0_9PEZI|nr:six-hairpin glycosidase [Colletotrichum scovillei]KAG7056565.1 six-hairpin glycosidase [Colletotrichum scovillei]KAG7066464.1 six-hairpin glycosidase [Colletotrichum scovillei]
MKATLLLCLSVVVAAAIDLDSHDFRISINDKTGAIDKITDPRFENVMNWVSTGSNAPWLPTGSRWGLGYADLGQYSLHRSFWNFPRITKHDNTIDAVYNAGPMELWVSRSINHANQSFTESYTFTNKGATPLKLDSRGTTSLAIYTPFNDHYTNTSDCSAVHSEQFVRIETDNYTTITKETGSISLTGAPVNANTKISGQAVQCDDDKCYYNFTAGRPGRTNLVVTTENGYNSTIFLNVVPRYDDLIASRTQFIIENQQDLTPDTPAEGA